MAAIAMPYGSTPGEITAGTKNNNFPPKNLSRFILLNSYLFPYIDFPSVSSVVKKMEWLPEYADENEAQTKQ
ncbi:MAG: hypothetical protein AUJ57_00560 [Zetaproteobacteria bacterium CG1_02_53_45]|nr:MAG: hypothetical protein AUJ57_00560 [Zetaproteobacteria bacterium CG1_02_53_45]